MTLVNPGVDYKGIRDDIVTLLRNNVAKLNTGLTAGTFTAASEQIVPGNPLVTPSPMGLYPVIMVQYTGKSEQFTAIGNATRKRPEIRFRIHTITMKWESDIDAEALLLLKNVEAVFRDNIEFSNKILYSDIGANDPFFMSTSDGIYCHVIATDLTCIVEVK